MIFIMKSSIHITTLFVYCPTKSAMSDKTFLIQQNQSIEQVLNEIKVGMEVRNRRISFFSFDDVGHVVMCFHWRDSLIVVIVVLVSLKCRQGNA